MEDRILEYLDTIEGAIAEHGPDAVDLALTVARIDAAQTLLYGLGLILLAGVVCGPFTSSVWSYAKKHCDPIDSATTRLVYGAVGGPTCLTLLVFGFEGLLNAFAWIGLFQPEVWIAHKALAALT